MRGGGVKPFGGNFGCHNLAFQAAVCLASLPD
jgi:hypothetical protein